MKYLLRLWVPIAILAVTAAAHAFKHEQEDVDKNYRY